MTEPAPATRWRADGKFLSAHGTRVFPLCVTYGPFPGGWPASFQHDFSRIAASGIQALRLYQMPDRHLLDAAQSHNLAVFAGLNWGQNHDFIRQPHFISAAQVNLAENLRHIAHHPALAGIYVGNEIPADLARWIGPVRVRQTLENLITLGKQIAPHLLFAYANYPSTEYLEPENADFTAFNLYLENEPAFRSYLKRLHHIAGDRPLVISEFGLDSQRNGLTQQAQTLRWALAAARQLETAAFTLYAWSDRWWNNGNEVLDWDFGLTDRLGNPKPALASTTAWSPPPPLPTPTGNPTFSVIICTRNGHDRIHTCLTACSNLAGNDHEILVVDDGSTDATAHLVATRFPHVRLIQLPPSGLSAARNAGAHAAHGNILAFTDDDCEPDPEWLTRLLPHFHSGKYAAVGGPNLPPPPQTLTQAVIAALPGAPSHVLLDDEEAEHLPGCNIAVRKDAFHSIGGFDPQFRTAGDDVDFCWRLSHAGHRLGFAPGAFVWHHRRPSIRAFLRQQIGYGKAEKLLLQKHPTHFSPNGGAKWRGFVYGGGPIRATGQPVIYHGLFGNAPFQSLISRTLPLRPISPPYDTPPARALHRLVSWLTPRLRAWHRNHQLRLTKEPQPKPQPSLPTEEITLPIQNGLTRQSLIDHLLNQGWTPSDTDSPHDLQKNQTHLLIATEYNHLGPTNLLLRLQGNPSLLSDLKDPKSKIQSHKS